MRLLRGSRSRNLAGALYSIGSDIWSEKVADLERLSVDMNFKLIIWIMSNMKKSFRTMTIKVITAKAFFDTFW